MLSGCVILVFGSSLMFLAMFSCGDDVDDVCAYSGVVIKQGVTGPGFREALTYFFSEPFNVVRMADKKLGAFCLWQCFHVEMMWILLVHRVGW